MTKPDDSRSRGFVSAQAVADLAGVSRSAVSRAFTDGASVSEATRRKVMAAAEQLGYHVNHLARGLIRERSSIVSLVVSDLRSPYYGRLIEEITRAVQRHDRVVLLIDCGGDDASAARALRQSLNFRAEATVVLSGTPSSSLVETCLANGQHVILLNRTDTSEGTDLISVDNEAAAAEAFRLFVQAGCRRHVVVSSANRTPSLVARERAYVAAARAAGVAVQVVTAGPTSYAAGAAAARQVLDAPAPPDAAFCVTDLIALGFLDTARSGFGLSVPDDLCVIGFDDIDQAAWESYRLTTFRQPLDAVAAQIAGLLTEKGAGSQGRRITLAAPPVWRQTVRGPAPG